MANALPVALGTPRSPAGHCPSRAASGLSMLLGELITANQYDLPVKVVVFNNSTLGW